jgi:hypothetical protein
LVAALGFDVSDVVLLASSANAPAVASRPAASTAPNIFIVRMEFLLIAGFPHPGYKPYDVSRRTSAPLSPGRRPDPPDDVRDPDAWIDRMPVRARFRYDSVIMEALDAKRTDGSDGARG